MNYENEDFEYEDIDLLELINNDSNSTNQYLLFEGSNDEIYAMNVAKIIEILTFKDLNMVKNSNNSMIKGTAKIRDDIATVVNFDQWFENEVLEEKDYEYLILAGFGGYNMGIMVKNVEYIVTIDSVNMQDNSINNPKTNFIADIKLNGQNKLCTIFDTDKMLLDIFDINIENKTKLQDKKETIKSNKTVLFADDSRYIRKLVTDLFKELGLNFSAFENGQELLDKLSQLGADETALVITDLEMPVMDGIHLIKNIREKDIFKDINIIVHTNMSNFITKDYLLQLGSCEVIDKINIQLLSEAVSKYIK